MSCRTHAPQRGTEFPALTDRPKRRSTQRLLLGLLDGLLNGLSWAALLALSLDPLRAIGWGFVTLLVTLVVTLAIDELPSSRHQRLADVAHLSFWGVAIGIAAGGWVAAVRTLLSGVLVLALAVRRTLAHELGFAAASVWIELRHAAALATIELRHTVTVARIQLGRPVKVVSR